MQTHRDALGNDIVIGQRYGYTTGNNGITRVVVGVVAKLTEQKAVIKVEKLTTYAYGGLSVAQDQSTASTRAVYGCNIFPVA